MVVYQARDNVCMLTRHYSQRKLQLSNNSQAILHLQIQIQSLKVHSLLVSPQILITTAQPQANIQCISDFTKFLPSLPLSPDAPPLIL